MAMTRTIPCKAKAVPSLVVEGTHLVSFSNKQQAADSSSVLVVVGPEASRSISQVVAVEFISESRSFDSITTVSGMPALLLTVCLGRTIHFHLLMKQEGLYFDVRNRAKFYLTENEENTRLWLAHLLTPSLVFDQIRSSCFWWKSRVRTRSNRLRSFSKDAYPTSDDLLHDTNGISADEDS
jgi:hypothetical protein